MIDSMQNSINKLVELGLSETEAIIYKTGIESAKPLSASDIQKITNIKRPTVYHSLDRLIAKGLAAKSSDQTKLHYSFSPPRQLQNYAKAAVAQARQKLEMAEAIIPTLETLQTSHNNTLVSHYEGLEGVKSVLEQALYCRKRSWDILAPRDNFLAQVDSDYSKYFMAARKRRDITARSLWEREFRAQGKPLTKKEIEQRNPRYLPEAMNGSFKSLMILFDDKVAIISSLDELSAVLIESKELSGFFASLFEGLWSVGDEYQKVVNRR